MYNGIGLATVRGSGTNGYVQRNTAHISKGRQEEKFKTEEDIRFGIWKFGKSINCIAECHAKCYLICLAI